MVEFDQLLLFEGGQFGGDLLEVGHRQVAEGQKLPVHLIAYCSDF